MVKWIFDRMVALVAIIALLPLFVIIALVVLVANGRPVFFKQIRIGQGGKKFVMVKFRTMAGVEENSISTLDSSRITKTGDFLRRTKLDELPELWNILKGDMSLVGPRPDVPGYADQLTGDDRVILKLKPGLTGIASLKYRNEDDILKQQPNPQEYNDTVIWPDKVRLNKIYIECQSLWLDLKIILYTALGKEWKE
ncbi:MAG: sugar transferase [Salinivirgaceae bacterium]|nr:sugar transferase [Salinivirgaceae bacterium]